LSHDETHENQIYEVACSEIIHDDNHPNFQENNEEEQIVLDPLNNA